MKKIILAAFSCLFFIALAFGASPAQSTGTLRAPAYPLVTIDPYTSCWSFGSTLNEQTTQHWTGGSQPLIGSIRVDGKNYCFMGKETIPMIIVLPMASAEPWTGHYTFDQPAAGWEKGSFNDAGWKQGKAAFGTDGMNSRNTKWDTKDIWVRREFVLNKDYATSDLFLKYSHDDTFELYINGIRVVKTGYEWHNNVLLALSPEVRKSLKKGKNIISAHCSNLVGGGLVDFGLYQKQAIKSYFDTNAKQTSVNVTATQTIYTFRAGGVKLNLTFTSPLLCSDLYLLSRPVSYITYTVSSADKANHNVQVYFEATPEWAVDAPTQAVVSDRKVSNGLTFLSAGTKSQKLLSKSGDDVRIDWGYFYLVGKNTPKTTMMVGDYSAVKKQFGLKGVVLNSIDKTLSGDMNKQMTVLAYSEDLGKVNAKGTSGFVMVGYDDIKSVQYFGDNLDAYWKKNGKVTIQHAFEDASKEYAGIMQKCNSFDKQLVSEATACGGEKYAELCALAYRQTIAAHKLVADKKGELLLLSKENFSNGSIGTVDVTYPSAPMFLLYNTELAKGLLNFIFEYSESGKWTKPFAAHDLGTYPIANGQTYGGDMPVEESGNMLIITTAIAIKDGNAAYAKKHWKTLTTWADYLVENGLNPDNQLCTDDFAGHSAHNTNLSIKAILGIAGYGKLAEMLGEKEIAKKYTDKARDMAIQWVVMADDGDHYRLNFDKPGTWSQKYNLVWDKLLGLNIFPKEIAQKEIAYYLTKQNIYGLPLDSRKDYSKSDWIMWTATMAADKQTFEKLIAPVYRYANETTDRIPLSDFHNTITGKSENFRARSVVGGFFIKMLDGKLVK